MWTWYAALYLYQCCPVFIVTEVKQAFSLQVQSYHCSMAIGTGQVEGSPIKAIKKNTFESVLMRWMKLEPIIQSEVSQKEKYQYSILMHIYGI